MRHPFIAAAATAAAMVLAPPAASRQACPVENGSEDMLVAPVVQPIASERPVRLRPGATLALEAVALVTRAYGTDRAIRLAGDFPFTYKSGALVSAIRTEGGERRCLRDFVDGAQGPDNGGLVSCLVDSNGDGAYEAADLFRRSDIAVYGRPARFERVAQVPLEQPVPLAEAAPLILPGHLAAFRRIVVSALSGDSVSLRVEHATLAPVAALRRVDGRLEAPPRGAPKFEPIGGGLVNVPLAEGVATAGGIRFRIGRDGRRWTMTPLDPRFPDWIAFDCGGSRLRIGRP
jgi:hypothetical protein